MPIEINFLDDGAGIEFICTCALHGDEFIKIDNKLHRLPSFSGIRYLLVDFSRVESSTVTPEQIRTIAEKDVEASKSNRDVVAVIVCNSDVVYGFARMWFAYADKSSWDAKLFRDGKEARNWIDRHIMGR